MSQGLTPADKKVYKLRSIESSDIRNFFDELADDFNRDAQTTLNEASVEAFRIKWAGTKDGILKQVNREFGKWMEISQTQNRVRDFTSVFGPLMNKFRDQLNWGITRLQIHANLHTAGDVSTPITDDLMHFNLEEQDQAITPQKRADEKDLLRQSRAAMLDREAIDITLPGKRSKLGAEHPLIKTWHEVVAVFQAMGYSVGVGPEVETDYYNFESLNFPPGHPARDTQDTLVVANQDRKPLRDRLLMRTHTSPVQIRTMEQQPPPVRIVIPGKVHRNDAADATHSPIFHQIEGLCVDTNITFSDLKGTLDHAMKALFGSSVKTRFFPSFFPFTEPSADVQISCPFCGGKGCRKCKHSGWIELLGCGMVDPAVFGFVQQKQPAYDPKKISGFAFGMGIDRIAMMKYGISDIGLFYSGDQRFLEQFS